MSLPSLNSDELTKLRRLIEEGVRTKQEISDLNEGLNDTIKAVAEELDVPTKVLRKSITIAFKNNLDEVKEELSDAEDLVNAARNKNLGGM